MEGYEPLGLWRKQRKWIDEVQISAIGLIICLEISHVFGHSVIAPLVVYKMLSRACQSAGSEIVFELVRVGVGLRGCNLLGSTMIIWLRHMLDAFRLISCTHCLCTLCKFSMYKNVKFNIMVAFPLLCAISVLDFVSILRFISA